jgi:hypothetical protein
MDTAVALRAYVLLLHAKTARDGFPVRYLKKGCVMTTPAEISKLTDQARRAKALMAQTTVTLNSADRVITNYEKTLNSFASHVDRISKEDAALSATIAEMGNAAPALEAAFQPDTPSKPAETAHLNEKK